jgi:signal transduction histidine kinase
MRSIVENLLMLAHADDASLGLLRTPVDLAEVTATVAESASTLARPKDVKLVTDGSSVTVRADRVRIEQVGMNLVSNAIRFSPLGGVVHLSTWARDGGGGFTVTDEGPGVSPDLGGRVFERFVRGDSARASDGGSGLGLAICREIVSAHDGRIWVDARAGAGASFSVWLPLTSG